MRLLSHAFAALLLLGQPALASTCTYPQDVAALKVASLKSELMVTAITCQDSTRYNEFMARYQPDLVMHERNLLAYFVRAYGRGGQKAHDDYITSLANAESNSGLADGTNLCLTNEPMFDEVMALPSANDLPDYAAGKDLSQPFVAVSCADLPPVTPPVTRSRSRWHRALRKSVVAQNQTTKPVSGAN